MNKKFILSVIAVFVVSMVLGFVTHGWLLSDEYNATGLMRSEAEQEAHAMWMLLAHVIMSVALVVLYRKGLEDKPWAGQGIRFGFWLAMFGAVGVYMIYYAVQPVPGMLAVRQAAYDTINLMILGLVVAFMHR
ncbi:MAG: hypothetical protein HKN58_08255 [Xanthomonadales bacterium]|nr:hypothetical protein [Xanthomonadales bacterium]